MKIQVTLEFNSPEEAIVALGKYVKDAPAPKVDDRKPPTSQPSAPAAEGTPKRGRGRPKKAAEPVKSSSTEAPQATQAPAPAAPVVEEKVSTQSAPPELSDVVAALGACLKAVGMDKTRACLARHGVSRGAEVKPEQRAEFIAYVNKVAAKEIDPEATN